MTTPIPSRPPTGKKVAIVEVAAVPAFQYVGDTTIDAIKALGWTSKVITYTTDPGGALLQAINAKVDYIVALSLTTSVVQPQLDAAHAAGIPVINVVADVPSDPSKGYYTTASQTTADFTPMIAARIINKSSGKANVVYVTELAAVSFSQTNQIFKKYFADHCPNCTYSTLNVTSDQVGSGAVPALVASYLQSHPKVNYVDMAFADLTSGLIPTLQSANLLSRVSISGASPVKAQLVDIASGKQSGWAAIANGAFGWQAVDILARLSVNEDISQLLSTDAVTKSPADPWIVATAEAAKSLENEPYGWPGPENFQQQYEKLWKVVS